MPQTDKEKSIVAATVATAPRVGKPKRSASLLSNDRDDYVKILLQGHTGTGKTRALADILQTTNADGRPTRIFVASTDIGGNGLRSVKEELIAIGKVDLLANLAWMEYTNFRDWAAFTTSPDASTEIAGKPFWSFDPDVLCWDGMANWQESLLWNYIMDIESISKDASEAREAGVQAGIVEWGQIRRTTILETDRFVTIHNPNGKRIHKVVTVLMDQGKESKLTKETQRGPLIMGGARDYIGPAFDAILTTVAFTPPGTKVVNYSYKCEVGNGSTVAKVRGFKLSDEFLKKADMKSLWSTLTGTVAKPAVTAA